MDYILPDAIKAQIRTIFLDCFREVQGERAKPSPAYSPELDLVDIEEAALILRRKKNTLYEYTSTRKIPHIKIGKNLLFSRKALLEWAASHSKGSDTDLMNAAEDSFLAANKKGGYR